MNYLDNLGWNNQYKNMDSFFQACKTFKRLLCIFHIEKIAHFMKVYVHVYGFRIGLPIIMSAIYKNPNRNSFSNNMYR